MKHLLAAVLLSASPAAAEDFLRIEAGGAMLAVPASQVRSVTASGPAAAPAIRVRLDPAQDAAFAALTAGAVGTEVVILVCGREVSRAHLVEPMTKADFMLGLPPDPAQARQILAQLRATAC